MMYCDTPRLARTTCTAFSNFSKRNPPHFCLECARTNSLPVRCLCSESHMRVDILMSSLHETRQAEVSWSSRVMSQLPVLQLTLIQWGDWLNRVPCDPHQICAKSSFYSPQPNKVTYFRTHSFKTTRGQDQTLTNFSIRILQKYNGT
jgi:hypothetical protein